MLTSATTKLQSAHLKSSQMSSKGVKRHCSVNQDKMQHAEIYRDNNSPASSQKSNASYTYRDNFITHFDHFY